MWSPRSLLVCAAALPLALADIQFTSPPAGATVSGGSSLSVEWKDSGAAPALADLTSYQLFICAGSNQNLAPTCASLSEKGDFALGNKVSAPVPVGLGASTPKNAYFIKMISIATAGGQVINFSERFSLSGMTGIFPPTLLTDLQLVSDTKGPPTLNQVAGAQPGGSVGAGDPQFRVPYTMQTGNTKYAPMQPLPPTKITQTKTSRLHPTSAVSIARTFLRIPSVVTTVTENPTYVVKSHENQATPAPHPQDDMQKYLNRWKD